MTKGITVVAVLVAVLAITSGSFAAANHYLITDSGQIKNGAVSAADLSASARKALQGQSGSTGAAGPQGIAGAQGAKGDTGATGPQGSKGDAGAAGTPGKDGATGATGATGPQGSKGDTGAAGTPGKDGDPGKDGASGKDGATGPQGLQGATGATGATGADGAVGATGEKGPKGDKGENGAAWAPSYASASVMVQRGAGGNVPWATYSTTLGAPTGDTTGGVFRFTCKDTHGTCKVSIQASGPAGTTVYPRVLIYKQDFNAGGPSINCEYGDGATNAGDFEPVGSALTMGIGGSLDCPGGTQEYPAGGTATTIDVPAGYYDVWSTFNFKQSS